MWEHWYFSILLVFDFELTDYKFCIHFGDTFEPPFDIVSIIFLEFIYNRLDVLWHLNSLIISINRPNNNPDGPIDFKIIEYGDVTISASSR